MGLAQLEVGWYACGIVAVTTLDARRCSLAHDRWVHPKDLRPGEVQRPDVILEKQWWAERRLVV